MPGNDSDACVIALRGRAFAIRQLGRPGAFRASGSGLIAYRRRDFDERCVRMAIEAAPAIDGDCVALDFVFNEAAEPRIIEISYSFVKEICDTCEGFWLRDLNWRESSETPQEWMVDLTLKQARERGRWLPPLPFPVDKLSEG